MQAVLYVAHGSRVKKGVKEAKFFLQQTIEKVEISIQEICFLELAEPTILQGVENCVKRGATKIAVVPILLLTANHLKQDIPHELAIVKQHFPHVSFTLGKAFGVDDRIVTSLVERIQQTTEAYTDAKVMLVGRGSSDVAVQRDLGEVAQRLQQHAQLKQVDTCFLYGAGMPFEEAVEKLGSEEKEVIFITSLFIIYRLIEGNY